MRLVRMQQTVILCSMRSDNRKNATVSKTKELHEVNLDFSLFCTSTPVRCLLIQHGGFCVLRLSDTKSTT